MNVEHLKYLIAIGKERTMADAAEKLFVTPQALSMAIKKLENELNMKLLYRFPNGVMLSENGEWLAELSQKFFDDIEKRKKEYADYIDEKEFAPTGKAELAVNSMGITSSKLTDMICNIYQKYPHFDIDIVEQPRYEVEQSVIEEKSEFGFIYRTKLNGHYIDELHEELSFHPLQMGSLIVQAAPHLQLAKMNNVFFKKIAKNKFCSYNPDKEVNNTMMLLKLLNCGEIDYSVMSSFSQYKTAVTSGKYLSLSLKMSEEPYCANYIEGMKMIFLQDNISCYFGIIRKKKKPLSNNMKYIFTEVLNMYNLNWSDLTAEF